MAAPAPRSRQRILEAVAEGGATGNAVVQPTRMSAADDRKSAFILGQALARFVEALAPLLGCYHGAQGPDRGQTTRPEGPRETQREQ
jgi:hypothetical protein